MVEIVHSKPAKLKLVELCPAMDLVACYTSELSLQIYRTFTWERVYNKSFKDIKNFDTITSLKFSPDGKLISASSCSIQIVIDIESGIVCDHHVDCSTADSTKDLSHAEWIVETKLGWNQRDLCLVDDLLNDDRIDETIDALSRQINFLFSRYECNKTLRFYQSGIRPILQLQLDRVNKFISQNQKGDNILGFCKSSEHDFIVDVIICNFNEKFASAWKMSKLISSIQSSLKSIDETTTSLNKRWKESTRVLPAKLLLLKALLHGYQYEGDVFDFFASVCLCGLWHPAAQATFSQHWNEQGLARLRSSLDSTTKYIIRTIQFKLLPFAINITNQLRQYLMTQVGHNKDLSSIFPLKSSCELQIQYLDAALSEAKKCRESLLLFVQFIKDFSQDSVEISLEKRLHYLCLFNGKSPIHDLSNPEYISSTNLSAILQSLHCCNHHASSSVYRPTILRDDTKYNNNNVQKKSDVLQEYVNQEKLYEKFSIDLVGIKNLSSEEACEILHIEVSLKSMQGLLIDSCESLVSPKIFAALDGIPKKSYTFGIIKTFLVLNGDKINAVTTIFPALDGGFDCGYFSTKTIKVTDRLLVRGKNVLGIKSEAQIVNSSSVSNIVGSLVSILQFESNSTYIFAEKLTNMTFKKFQNGDEAWIHPLCPNIVLPKALELSLSDSWDCVVCGPRGILAIFDSEKVVILDMDAEEDSPDLDESEDIE